MEEQARLSVDSVRDVGSTPDPPQLGPIDERARIAGIDTARGLALLGIFFVNAAFFGVSLGELINESVPKKEGTLSVAAWWLTSAFCTGKFYPLFSLLFGVGLAMMYESARRAGRGFGWLYFRRLLVLALFGAAHVVLLWPGDVLLIYAASGVWMLLLGRCRPRTLIVVAAAVFVAGLVISFLFVRVIASGSPEGGSEVVARPMREGASRLAQFAAVLQDWNSSEPFDSRIIELENGIMREGPFLHAVAVRLFNYALTLIFVAATMFWIVLPCFCLGAALLKAGFFRGQLPQWRRRFLWAGAVIGLPLSLCFTTAVLLADQPKPGFGWQIASLASSQIAGPLMSLMYLSAILAWVDSGRAAGASRALARLGRMALTGYLLESVLMSAVMLHWGLARFGRTTWSERAVWVVALWLLILLLANLWMKRFRFGPLEWLWRSAIYRSWQPLRG